MIEGMLENFDPQQIQDIETRKIVIYILNLVEELNQKNIALSEEIQRLRDENNRLKGEQGKPNIKESKKSTNHSSEKERKEGTPRPKRKKRRPHHKVVVNRKEKLVVEKSTLPEDAQFKGCVFRKRY